jgi:fructokinase
MAIYLLGADVGGTKSEVCLIELAHDRPKTPEEFAQYKVLSRERMSTEKDEGLESFTKRLKALFDHAIGQHGIRWDQIASVGLGLPGSIDPVTQYMASGSIPFFKGFALDKYFAKELGFQGPVDLDNDANCFALAETYLGAGNSWSKKSGVPLQNLCMVGITLGTGVGGGLVVNGRLIRGRRGGAGEIGHVTLIDSGRPCYCGKFGCSEQYLSGTAFETSYAMRASALEPMKGTQIFELAEKGDPIAIATIEYYRDHLVDFMSNISNFIDPHIIILGGGMSQQKRLYDGISARLGKGSFLTENPPEILANECGGSAGVLGAALLGFWKELG